MEKNPADEIKSTMWSFLMTKGQKANIPALKDAVYDLIGMTTQKTAGQRGVKKDIDWSELGMTMMSIVIEATALVLSGELDGEAEWIPVGERLPEENGTYLTTLDGELVGQEEPFTGMCGFENGRWDEEGCVIAWKPMPAPYEEDADEH